MKLTSNTQNPTYAVAMILINFVLKPAVIEYLSTAAPEDARAEWTPVLADAAKPDHIGRLSLQFPDVLTHLGCITKYPTISLLDVNGRVSGAP